MKTNLFGKKILICIIASCLLVGMVQGNLCSNEVQNFERNSSWTVMLYLNGDNTLSTIQAQVLEAVRQVGSSAEVNLAVLIDQKNNGDTMMYYIVGTTLMPQAWPAESAMDDPDTICQFFNTVKNDYLSDYYALILSSNKGCGWQGVSWDDHGDGVMITMPELLTALQNITNNGSDKIDVFGVETCNGGNFEVSYQVASCCEYFVGYPECALAGDWPYVDLLQDLKNDSTMMPEELAACIVNNFVPQYVPQYNMYTTMAALDLDMVPLLGDAIDDLAQVFLANYQEYTDAILDTLESTKTYGILWDITYYIDLYHFLDLLPIEDPDVVTAKNTVMGLINTTVIANACLVSDDAHGFNFYFPREKSDYNKALRYEELPSPYEETEFAVDTQWDEFLKTYLGVYNNSAPDAPTLTGKLTGKINTPYELTLSATDPDNDNLYYCIDWGDESNETSIGPYASGSEIVCNHTYTEKGYYTIQAKTRDELGAESDWATLKIYMPRGIDIDIQPRSVLIGKISDLEKTAEGSFCFLPQKVLHISYNTVEGLNVSVIDDSYGGFPCCGYIADEDFRGIILKTFVCGVWKIPV